MITSGIVVFIPKDGFIVVKHDRGFTVIELIEDAVDISRGDRIGGDWSGPCGSVYKLGIEYDAHYSPLDGDLETAVERAQFLASGIPNA